jgi:hypothetical protein
VGSRGLDNMGVALGIGESQLALGSFNSLTTILVSCHRGTTFVERRADGA